MSTNVRLMDAEEIRRFGSADSNAAPNPGRAESAGTGTDIDGSTAVDSGTASEAGFGALETVRGNLPLEAIDLRAVVTGLAVGTELAQTFRNPFTEPLEATYIFPLPDRAAVTALRMEADGRVVEGVLKERGEARADYDQAIVEGRRASIAEQERPDVFTLRVGNIMPGERVVVRLALAGLLPFEDGAATFRFPLVVAPRYIPGAALPGAPVGDGTAADTDAVPDASRISPPVLLPGFPSPVRLSAQVDIDPAGLPTPDVRSSLHSVFAERTDGAENSLRVRLTPGERADCDFVLRLGYGSEDVVTTALAVRRDEPVEVKGVTKDAAEDAAATSAATDADAAKPALAEEGTFALTLVPPTGTGSGRPKDVTLLLDRSGSMDGWKIVAARRAAARIVDSLSPDDRFAVWSFDHEVERPPTLPAGLVPASDRHRFRAVEHLASVDARGGTEILEPLREALDLLLNAPPAVVPAGGAAAKEQRDKVLVLVTDGQVGNEEQILRALGPQLGAVRVHTVGVDTAVHAGFLRSLAALGGGRCELVESEDRLDEAMRAIHHRIATPLITELRVEAAGLTVIEGSVTPARLPDLFPGAPVVITGRLRGGIAGGVTVTGRAVDGSEWRQTVTATPGDNPSLSAIWARERIRDLEDAYATGRSDTAELERRITETSLAFRVLCRFTAFVAVDQHVVNAGGAAHRVVQPVESPRGWVAQSSAFGGVPFQAASAPVAAAPMAAPPAQPAAESMKADEMSLDVVSTRSVRISKSGLSAGPGAAQSKQARAPRASGGGGAPASPAAPSPGAPPSPSYAQPSGAVAREKQREADLLPAIPAEVRAYAAGVRRKLRELSGGPLKERSEYLVVVSIEITQRVDRFAAAGLFEPWLRVLRELALELAGAAGDATHTQHLWLRAVDVFDALAGDEQAAEAGEPGAGGKHGTGGKPGAEGEHAAAGGRRGSAFWKRG